MCELSITWVGVSDERLRVVGLAEGDDCTSDVEVTLDIRADDGSTSPSGTRTARWLDAQTWEALFALTAEERRQVCREVRVPDVELPYPGFVVSARCEACAEPAAYARRLECCPRVEVLPGETAAVCEDPDRSGVLRPRRTVRWRVTRGNADGPVVTRASLGWGGVAQARGGDRTLPDSTDPAQWQEFADSFLVPPETELRFEVELVRPLFSCAGVENILIPALPPCDCTGHEESTSDFTVTDENGADITEAVARRDCVSATRVRVSAPADVRGERFIWLPPAVADQNDPFSTTAEVPDTDEGVKVTAQIGSGRCTYERFVTVRRCQTRAPFCGSVRLPCGPVEGVGVLAFYACLCLLFNGLGIVGGASAKGVLARFVTTIAEAVTSGAASVPEPVASKIAAAVAAVVSVYGELSTGLAAWAATVGLVVIWLALVALVVSLLLLAYWLGCCAPRSWLCRFLVNLHWCIQLFLATQWFWALLLMVVCLIFDIGNIFVVAGIGFAAIFSYLLSGLVGPLVQFIAFRLGCRPVWLWEPPFLS